MVQQTKKLCIKCWQDMKAYRKTSCQRTAIANCSYRHLERNSAKKPKKTASHTPRRGYLTVAHRRVYCTVGHLPLVELAKVDHALKRLRGLNLPLSPMISSLNRWSYSLAISYCWLLLSTLPSTCVFWVVAYENRRSMVNREGRWWSVNSVLPLNRSCDVYVSNPLGPSWAWSIKSDNYNYIILLNNVLTL